MAGSYGTLLGLTPLTCCIGFFQVMVKGELGKVERKSGGEVGEILDELILSSSRICGPQSYERLLVADV